MNNIDGTERKRRITTDEMLAELNENGFENIDENYVDAVDFAGEDILSGIGIDGNAGVFGEINRTVNKVNRDLIKLCLKVGKGS